LWNGEERAAPHGVLPRAVLAQHSTETHIYVWNRSTMCVAPSPDNRHTTRCARNISSMGKRDDLHRPPDRRAFVGLIGKGALVIAAGGLVRYREPKRTFRRPPGSAPEDEFVSLCNRCGKCIEECPNIIVAVTLAESVVSAGTPKMLFNCGRCMRCAYACPTGALLASRR
jgi:ferredoxin